MKKFFLILGLPRSGTTLLNNILNSQSNIFSISEPIWEKIQTGKINSFGKINLNTNLQPIEIVPKLQQFLKSSDTYDYGGIKETFRHWELLPVSIAQLSNIDFIFRIKRNPIDCFGSWKEKTSWGNNYTNIDSFITSYKEISSINHDNIIDIDYDLMIDNGIDYLNNVLPFTIERFEVSPTNFGYGDVKANNSTKIEKRPSKKNISTYELQRLKEL